MPLFKNCVWASFIMNIGDSESVNQLLLGSGFSNDQLQSLYGNSNFIEPKNSPWLSWCKTKAALKVSRAMHFVQDLGHQAVKIWPRNCETILNWNILKDFLEFLHIKQWLKYFSSVWFHYETMPIFYTQPVYSNQTWISQYTFKIFRKHFATHIIVLSTCWDDHNGHPTLFSPFLKSGSSCLQTLSYMLKFWFWE